jgi:hypothetical protein
MRFLFLLILFVAASAWAQSPPEWVQKSNQNAQLLIAIMARYAPEDAAAQGVPGLDEQISTSSTDLPELFRRDLTAARNELEKRLAEEKNPLVRQDLRSSSLRRIATFIRRKLMSATFCPMTMSRALSFTALRACWMIRSLRIDVPPL